jgi:hypothetical protein
MVEAKVEARPPHPRPHRPMHDSWASPAADLLSAGLDPGYRFFTFDLVTPQRTRGPSPACETMVSFRHAT